MRRERITRRGAAWFLAICFLTACGTSAPPPTPSPEPTATAAPTVAPTATAVATAAPSATPAPPTPTEAAPTPTPDTLAGAGADALPLDTQASGACANAFYPLRDDWVWLYRITTDGIPPTDYRQSFSDISADGFTSLVALDDYSAEARWLCSADGIISTDYASIALGAMPGFEFETLDYAGVYLLPEEQWAVGAAWEATYDVQANFTTGGVAIESEMEISMENEIVAVEAITVPVGSFPEAYRVEATMTMDMSMNGSTTSVAVPVSQWYVRGVGLVKTTSTLEDTSSTELFALERK